MAAFTAALILGGLGLALDTVGKVKAGQQEAAAGEANKAAADSQAQIAEFNATEADRQAQDAIERGNEQESRYRTQIRQAIGTGRANVAANGVDVGSGSAVDVQADQAFLGELDALTIRTNASREAYGYTVQATDFRNRAKVARATGVYAAAAGQAAQAGSNLSAGANLLSGGASLLQMRYGYQHAGQY